MCVRKSLCISVCVRLLLLVYFSCCSFWADVHVISDRRSLSPSAGDMC